MPQSDHGQGAGTTRLSTYSATLRAAVVAARGTLDARAAFVAVVAHDGDAPIGEREGLHEPRWDRVVVRPGLGLGGRVLRERRPIALQDYFTDTTITADYRAIVKQAGLRAMVCTPIALGDDVDGLLYVALDGTGGLGDRFVDGARQLAELTAIGLGHARERASSAAQARRALQRDEPDALRALAQRVARTAAAAPATGGLTPRELEVLHLLAAGASNADVARRLVIAEATAKEHVRNLRRKLGARSRLEAVARGRDTGLL